MAWVNIDTAKPKATLHDDPNCPHVIANSGGTTLKGSGEILDDGGWMPFATVADAQAYIAANWSHLPYSQCCP